MATKEFWLASTSPRRREMLAWLDWEFQASAANIDESRLSGEKAREHVCRLAYEKVIAPIPDLAENAAVIAADTIVVLDEKIIGKPADQAGAYETLIRLRGRTHWVYTALAVLVNGNITQDICRSEIRMRDYTDEEISQYISGGDPMDKAGAYAIQNKDFHPVVDFTGCMASVMGMPLCHLERTLKKCSVMEPNGFARACKNHLKYKCSISARVLAGENIG